jgi:hypothetical protein
LNINAATDTVGFSVTPSNDGGTWGLTDQNKAWITPMPGLTFESGMSLETDDWRGTADFGSWDWLRFQATSGDSWTFMRIGEGGVASDVRYNKDGIGAWVLWDQGAAFSSGPAVNQSLATNAQAGAAFTITGVGVVKAQYIGQNVTNAAGGTVGGAQSSGQNAPATINAAFNLSAIPNLYEEVGVFVSTSAADAGYNFQLADYTSYTLDKLALHLQLGVISYNGNNGESSNMGIKGAVGADYDLGDKVTVTGDLRYTSSDILNSGLSTQAANTGNGMTGFMVGVSKGFSNGAIGVGFEYSNIALGGSFPPANTKPYSADNSAGHWAIPVMLTESF